MARSAKRVKIRPLPLEYHDAAAETRACGSLAAALITAPLEKTIGIVPVTVWPR